MSAAAPAKRSLNERAGRDSGAESAPQAFESSPFSRIE